jgi:hypothetical protein
MLSSDDGVIKVINKESNIIDTLLDSKELLRFYRYEPFDLKWLKILERTDSHKIFYDWLTGNKFIIYLAVSSTVYVFKNRELIDQFPVRPKIALQERQRRIDTLNKSKSSKEWQDKIKRFPQLVTNSFDYHYLFREFFVDKDSRDHFYLASFRPLVVNGKNLQNGIFKFTVKGELIEALYFNPPDSKREYCFVREKKNNLYYAIGQYYIYVFKR